MNRTKNKKNKNENVRKFARIDKVPKSWLNAISARHQPLANLFSDAINNPDENPEWITQGI